MDMDRLRARIKELLAAKGEKQITLAKKIGMETGLLSKILSGADGRSVKLEHLQKFADALGVHITAFLDEPLRVPIVGEVTLEGGPRHAALRETEVDEYVELFSKDRMMECYALTVSDRSMLPVFRPGTRLIAEKDSWDTIQTNDYVVYLGSNGCSQVKQILFVDEIFILKALNPAIPEMSLPKAHLKLCDKIVQINPA